jgi:glycerol-3-phosphate cytidylyltransferase-like family protein
METLILIAGLFLLFWFKDSIKGLASTAETVVDTVNVTADDSLKTYRNDVLIMNAEKRSEQFDSINNIDNVVTNKEIEDLLRNMNKPATNS